MEQQRIKTINNTLIYVQRKEKWPPNSQTNKWETPFQRIVNDWGVKDLNSGTFALVFYILIYFWGTFCTFHKHMTQWIVV